MATPTREPFAQIPRTLLLDSTVSAEAVRLFGFIATIQPKLDGWREVHTKTLAAAFGIQERHVKKLTARLVATGWLTKTGHGGCNRPARYLLGKVKTMSSQDTVFDQNHVLSGHGQEVDTADTLSTGEVRGNAARARETATAETADTAPGKKEFFKLHVGFIPPSGWEPILSKAQQARLDTGKGPLPISESFLIEKFCQRKVGKELTLDVIEHDLTEWYVREKPPRKTGGTQRTDTLAAPAPALPTTPAPALPTTPPSELISQLVAQLASSKNLTAPVRSAPQAATQDSTWNSNLERRARLAAEFQAIHGYPLPENCRALTSV